MRAKAQTICADSTCKTRDGFGWMSDENVHIDLTAFELIGNTPPELTVCGYALFGLVFENTREHVY